MNRKSPQNIKDMDTNHIQNYIKFLEKKFMDNYVSDLMSGNKKARMEDHFPKNYFKLKEEFDLRTEKTKVMNLIREVNET